MASVMAQEINSWKLLPQPTRQEVDGQRKAVHLDKQRDDESRERAEATPVARIDRLEEAEGEHDVEVPSNS